MRLLQKEVHQRLLQGWVTRVSMRLPYIPLTPFNLFDESPHVKRRHISIHCERISQSWKITKHQDRNINRGWTRASGPGLPGRNIPMSKIDNPLYHSLGPP